MPMSRITEKIASSTGTSWLGSASRPIAAATAVRPSSSGRPAATSAPKATTRMTSVTGSDSTSARWKSLSKRSEMPLLTVASPKASTRTDGFALPTAATADSICATCASVAGPSSCSGSS